MSGGDASGEVPETGKLKGKAGSSHWVKEDDKVGRETDNAFQTEIRNVGSAPREGPGRSFWNRSGRAISTYCSPGTQR